MNKSSLKIELVIVGDEILSGRTREANLQFLALFLKKKGLALHRVHVVHDDEIMALQCWKEALERSDIVINTGGLGPTRDDLTKDLLQKISNSPLEESVEATEVAKQNYQRFGREWNKESNSYHIIPRGILPLPNPKGLAPGLAYFYQEKNQQKKKALLCAPGVPHEFYSMLEEVFYPLIQNEWPQDQGAIQTLTLRTWGVPEEKIFFELCPGLWDKLERFGKVSSLPHLIGVDLVVTLHKDSPGPKEVLKQLQQDLEFQKLQKHLWHVGDENLEELIAKLLMEKNENLSLAESCTGGLASNVLTNLSGISRVFKGSVISYDNQVKIDLLDVQEKTLQDFGAVSLETAKEMAEGVRRQLKTDWAISFTGIAGPTGGTAEKPVGTVCIAVAGKQRTKVEKFQLKGDRQKLKERFVMRGLLMLLNEMRPTDQQ